jgi:hypothetical protein
MRSVDKTFLVVTTIAGQGNPVLQKIAAEASARSIPFIAVGDAKSPASFALAGCDFYPVKRQQALSFSLARQLPQNHYARKNIGYLLAIEAGADAILETDDDNFPYSDFWNLRVKDHTLPLYRHAGWLNVYRLFSDKNIWPRGFSLSHIRAAMPDVPASQPCKCPIQQGLADENPDVDAIYRLTGALPVAFEKAKAVAIGKRCWCPFNSQNTTWFKEAFPLLYLPSFCSFRMTDIWRSFVAQRICWENDWSVLFHHATAWQERNDHNLMRDFSDEVQGYLYNQAIAQALEQLALKPGAEHIPENLLACYGALIRLNLIGKAEVKLLEAWLSDVSRIK